MGEPWLSERRRLRAAFPLGVAAAKQLVVEGIPERTVYNRCRDRGPWQLVLPGIVALSTGHLTRDQLVAAALLLGGPGAVVTGLEACRRHGIRRGPRSYRDQPAVPDEVHLLIPHSRQVRTVGFVHVERTVRMPGPVLHGGFPLAPPERAYLDAARRLRDAADITELVADAVQRRLCTVGALHGELEAGSRRRTGTPREVLRGVGDGVRSAAERSARQLLLRAGLPAAWWNVAVHDSDGVLLGVADCWFDDVAMAWEIDSTEWHLAPSDHDRTVRKAARFASAGAVVFPSKPRDIHTDRATVLRMLTAAHRVAAGRPRPALRASRP